MAGRERKLQEARGPAMAHAVSLPKRAPAPGPPQSLLSAALLSCWQSRLTRASRLPAAPVTAARWANSLALTGAAVKLAAQLASVESRHQATRYQVLLGSNAGSKARAWLGAARPVVSGPAAS